MTRPVDLRDCRDQLTAILMELEADQAAFLELRQGYGVFAFTGGEVPARQPSLGAIAAYLKCPFAAGRVSTEEVDRYGHLVSTAMGLGRGALPPRPRTLRCRHQIAETFAQTSSEARSLGIALASAFRCLLKEVEPLLPVQAKGNIS